jgi:hypothetical protein
LIFPESYFFNDKINILYDYNFSNIIFKDYPEEMIKSFSNKEHIKWNLVDTGKLLFNRFASSSKNVVVNLFVIRADYFHLKSFAK